MYKFILNILLPCVGLFLFDEINEVFNCCDLGTYMQYMKFVYPCFENLMLIKIDSYLIVLQFVFLGICIFNLYLTNFFNGMLFYKIEEFKNIKSTLIVKYRKFLNFLKQFYIEKYQNLNYLYFNLKYDFLVNGQLYINFLVAFIPVFCIFVGIIDLNLTQFFAYWEVDPRYIDEFGPCILYEEQDTFRKFINTAEYEKYYKSTEFPDYRVEFDTPDKRNAYHLVMYYYTFDPLINYEDLEFAPVDVQHERLQHYYIIQKIYQMQFIEVAEFIAKNIDYKNYNKLKNKETIKKYVIDFDVIDMWHWLAVMLAGEFKTPLTKFIFGYSFMDLCNLANAYVKGNLSSAEKKQHGLNNHYDYVCLLFEIVYRLMYDEAGMLPLFGDDRHMNGDIKKIWVSGNYFGRVEVERMRGMMRFSDYYSDTLKNQVKLIMNEYIYVWWGSQRYMHSEAWPCNLFTHRHKFHNSKFRKYIEDHFFADKQKNVFDAFLNNNKDNMNSSKKK